MNLSKSSNLLSSVLANFKKKGPLYLRIYSLLKVVASGKLKLDVLVDTLPNPGAIVIRPPQEDSLDLKNARHLLTRHPNEHSIYAENADCLKKLLPEINWKRQILFTDLRFDHGIHDCVKEFAVGQNYFDTWSETEPLMTYTLEQEVTFPFGPEKLGTEFELVKLDEDHADVINKVWRYGGSDYMLHYIKSLIRHLPSYGITHKATGSLLACSLTYEDLAMGVGYVLPEYRKHGLMSFLGDALAREVRREFTHIYSRISTENQAPMNLVAKMNWERVEGSEATHATYTPKC